MRVSKDPLDKAFSETAGRRRAWCNDHEVEDWMTVDEFRRVIVDTNGRVYNGAVRVERLPEDSPPPQEVVEVPLDTGFAGVGLVHVPDQPKVVVEEQQQEQVHVHPDTYVPAEPVMLYVPEQGTADEPVKSIEPSDPFPDDGHLV